MAAPSGIHGLEVALVTPEAVWRHIGQRDAAGRHQRATITGERRQAAGPLLLVHHLGVDVAVEFGTIDLVEVTGDGGTLELKLERWHGGAEFGQEVLLWQPAPHASSKSELTC
jgi:hypothetical protein